MLNLKFADSALQGFTLTFQFFDLWIQGRPFLAFHRGRNLQAKELVFPSIQRWPANADLFCQSLRTFLTAIKSNHSSFLHGVRVIAWSICPGGTVPVSGTASRTQAVSVARQDSLRHAASMKCSTLGWHFISTLPASVPPRT